MSREQEAFEELSMAWRTSLELAEAKLGRVGGGKGGVGSVDMAVLGGNEADSLVILSPN